LYRPCGGEFVVNGIISGSGSLNQPVNTWMLGPALQAQMTRLDAVLARRDALVRAMAAKAESDASRTGQIAGGIVARLPTRHGSDERAMARPKSRREAPS